MKEQDLIDKFIAEGCLFANADKCVQITKDYADTQNKELIIALTNFVLATTKEFAEINGFGQQRKRRLFFFAVQIR